MTRRTWMVVLTIMAAWLIAIAGLQWIKYHRFGYNGLDLAIYTQTIWALSHGLGFASSIHNPSYLGDHLEVWLVPVSWVYRLWPSALTLLWIQTLVLGSAVIPLAKLADRYFGSRGAVVSAVVFAVHPLVYNPAMYEFHGLAFVLPILLWGIWWYDRQRWGWWLASLFALAAVREDVSLVLLGWAVLAAIERRHWRWWGSAAVLGLAWFGAAQAIIESHSLIGQYKYLAFYRWLGQTPAQMAAFPFHHPLVFLSHLFGPANWLTVLGLLLAAGFLSLLAPRRLWPLVFLTGQMLLLGDDAQSFLRLHYVLPYLPFLAWTALEGIDRLRRKSWAQDPLNRQATILVGLIVGLVYLQLLVGPAAWPWSKASYQPTSAAALRQAVGQVGANDRVIATFNVLPNLADRQSLYSLNYLYLGQRQYSSTPYLVPTQVDVAIIDWQQLYEYQFFYKTTVFQGRSGPQRINDFLQQQGLSLVSQDGTVAVYRRGGQAIETSAVPTTVPAPAIQRLGPIDLISPATMSVTAADNLQGTPPRQLAISQSWSSVATAPDQPISVRYDFLQAGQVRWSTTRLLGQGPQPATEWPVGSAWSTTAWFAVPLRGTVTVRETLERIRGLYRLDRWQTFRPHLTAVTKLGQVELGSMQL